MHPSHLGCAAACILNLLVDQAAQVLGTQHLLAASKHKGYGFPLQARWSHGIAFISSCRSCCLQ